MRYKKGEKVYVNYNDGIIEVEILSIHRDGYRVEVSDSLFIMGFKEVSKEAKRIKGAPPIRTQTFQQD